MPPPQTAGIDKGAAVANIATATVTRDWIVPTPETTVPVLAMIFRERCESILGGLAFLKM